MLEKIHQCSESRENIVLMDVTFEVGSAENDNVETISSNVSFLPLKVRILTVAWIRGPVTWVS